MQKFQDGFETLRSAHLVISCWLAFEEWLFASPRLKFKEEEKKLIGEEKQK